MLWYLLYPIRGTTQPPRLSANHPIRKAFYRHGKTTAQHWLIAMLVSVAIAMGASYPTVLLSENPGAGFGSFPHHVWTSTKSIDSAQPHADIEMRQIWVHGTYMGALDKNVLKHGLAIQQDLVDHKNLYGHEPIPGQMQGDSFIQWGYHSPFAFWNNSAEQIDEDPDIVETVNNQKYTSSSLNVILRPTSVFAGRKFARRRLLAADALIITLMNRVDDEAGSTWQHQMQSLTEEVCKDCTIYPSDGRLAGHKVYEFGFTPVTLQEHIAFTFAYTLMAIYVLLSLRRIKAFHSRFGLAVTAITQMTCSILSSFTICGILKINLSMIPQSAYPFVVLVIGLENMFRLINAVLAYPPTMATELRVANALGDVGPLSVAAAAQNLTILSLLSTVVSPGVAAFCAFAAIATLFDAFFLLTFFVAVLNVDIRRLELQDALTAKHGQARHGRRSSPHQHTWFDALVQGRLPFSTRMAGTAVTTTFILSLNYHFFEHTESVSTLPNLLRLMWNGPPSLADLHPFASRPLNASVTPGEWMQMQDLNTATEIMQMAKPGADKFVIRVFAPLVVVLSGSDRTQVPHVQEAWTHALRSFAVHHFYPVAVAVVFAVAFVAVLMNFLLYNEDGDEDDERTFEQQEESLLVHSMDLPHRLDIVKLASNQSGHFVTVSLDRTMVASISDWAGQAYHTISMPPNILESINWPIYNLAINDKGEWIALHDSSDQVLMIKCNDLTVTYGPLAYPDDHPTVLFRYIVLPSSTGGKLWFVVLTSGGRLAMYCVDDARSIRANLSDLPLVGATYVDIAGQGPQIITIGETSRVTAFAWSGEIWTESHAQSLQMQDSHATLAGPIGVVPFPTSNAELLLVTTPTAALFVESVTLSHVAKVDLAASGIVSDSFLLGPATECEACGGLAFRSISVLYEKPTLDGYALTTWHAQHDDEPAICLSGKASSCRGMDAIRKQTYDFAALGSYAVHGPHTVLGLRKPDATAANGEGGHAKVAASLRRRLQARPQMQSTGNDNNVWQAYQISVGGDLETLQLSLDQDPQHDERPSTAQLYVTEVGPSAALDDNSVVVAFGNTVKIVQASKRGGNAGRSVKSSLKRQPSTSRRRISSRRVR